MARQLFKLYGPSIYGAERTTSYANEWRLDDFDYKLNNILSGDAASAKSFALDIGCGTGVRAGNLAELNVFQTIYACDIADRSEYIRQTEQAITTEHSPIHFREINVVEFAISSLDGHEFSFINFRNVAHFLAPVDVKRAVDNIVDVLDDNGILAISFDKAIVNKEQAHPRFPLSWPENGESFYQRHFAPQQLYNLYSVSEVEDYLESRGLTIIPHRLYAHHHNIHGDEGHIIAQKIRTPTLGLP